MRKKLRILVPIILGVFFLYITFVITSQEERLLILDYIKSAKIEYLIGAMFLGASADIVRGLRWQLLSKAIGYILEGLIVLQVCLCATHLIWLFQDLEKF